MRTGTAGTCLIEIVVYAIEFAGLVVQAGQRGSTNLCSLLKLAQCALRACGRRLARGDNLNLRLAQRLVLLAPVAD